MPWLETPRPTAPTGLGLTIRSGGEATLTWKGVEDPVWQYAVYAIAAEDAVGNRPSAEAARLIGVTGETRLRLPAGGAVRSGDLLLVRAVSRANETGPPSMALRWKANPESVGIAPVGAPGAAETEKKARNSTPESAFPDTSPADDASEPESAPIE
jgi:hypothetical protein